MNKGAIHPRGSSVRTVSLILFLCLGLPFGCTAFLPSRRCSIPKTRPSQAMSSKIDQEGEGRRKLLDKASQLRQEATDLESKLRTEQVGKPKRNTPKVNKPDIIPVCKRIEDSVWTFTYRFSSQPESSDEEEQAKPRVFFGGKLSVKFRADGFTDIVAHETGDASKALSIVKTWGWDTEYSNQDETEYLLFSVDIKVPETKIDKAGQERFYLQARQEREGDAIVLKEGTVTVKRDVNDSASPGFWGVFSGKGILAQFRYVGDFVAKPSRS